MSLGHRQLAAWYVQLADLLEAGLSFVHALRSSTGTGVSAARLETMAVVVEAGGSIDEALHVTEVWLPRADRLAWGAAAATGRLPITLRHLAERHQQKSAAKRRLVAACVYPLVVMHVGFLLFPITRMIDWEKGFQWDAARYARGVAAGLVPLWLVVTTLAVLAGRESPVLRRMAGFMPAFRVYVRAQALADLAFMLGNFLSAGVAIGRAWGAAGMLSASPALQAAARDMEARVERGEAPGRALAARACFPSEFVALYRTGEETGQLETNLARLATLHQEAADRALVRATVIYPVLLSLVVAAGVVYFVVTFYAGYLKMLTGLAE